MSAPQLLTLLWRHWQPAPLPDVLAAATMLVYLAGVRRTRRWSAWRTLSFAAGIAVTLIAVQSGLGAEDDRLLSVHMVQHLLLLEIAPLLVLGGRPVLLMLRAVPRRLRPGLARRLLGLRRVTHPVVCLSAFTFLLAIWHTPGMFDATLRQSWLHDAEHLSFLLAGGLVWWPVLDGDPMPGRRLDGVSRLVYVMVAMLPMTLLGAFLTRDPSLLYAGYAAPAHMLGISAIADQQQAGAIMWVLGSSAMIVAGIWQAMAALAAEERRQQVRERHAAAVAVPDAGRRP